jgi:methylated-DNA-[protein]-cysteine S-methyltransferase
VEISGTEFDKKVWNEVKKIPYGEVVTYGELAKKLGTSPRAIGNALRRNPLPIYIPCHRVVGKGGKLRGFSAGLTWKSYLLFLEKSFKKV